MTLSTVSKSMQPTSRLVLMKSFSKNNFIFKQIYLIMSDIESLEKRKHNLEKKYKAQDINAIKTVEFIDHTLIKNFVIKKINLENKFIWKTTYIVVPLSEKHYL